MSKDDSNLDTNSAVDKQVGRMWRVFYRIKQRRHRAKPNVEVTKSVIDKLGEPEVDYNLYTRLALDEFAILRPPRLKLYGRLKNLRMLSFLLIK